MSSLRACAFCCQQVDYSGGDDPLDAAAAADTGVSTSKLDPRIQDLMRIFFDVQAIKKTLLSMEIGQTRTQTTARQTETPSGCPLH